MGHTRAKSEVRAVKAARSSDWRALGKPQMAQTEDFARSKKQGQGTQDSYEIPDARLKEETQGSGSMGTAVRFGASLGVQGDACCFVFSSFRQGLPPPDAGAAWRRQGQCANRDKSLPNRTSIALFSSELKCHEPRERFAQKGNQQ